MAVMIDEQTRAKELAVINAARAWKAMRERRREAWLRQHAGVPTVREIMGAGTARQLYDAITELDQLNNPPGGGN